MRGAALLSLIFAMASSAQAATGEPSSSEAERLLAEVQSCVSSNAAAVERAFDSLNEAADFLVVRLCAVQLAAFVAERHRLASAKMMALLSEASDASPSDHTVGEKKDAIATASSAGWTIYAPTSMQVPAEVAASAARTLLEFRTKRLDSAPQ